MLVPKPTKALKKKILIEHALQDLDLCVFYVKAKNKLSLIPLRSFPCALSNIRSPSSRNKMSSIAKDAPTWSEQNTLLCRQATSRERHILPPLTLQPCHSRLVRQQLHRFEGVGWVAAPSAFRRVTIINAQNVQAAEHLTSTQDLRSPPSTAQSNASQSTARQLCSSSLESPAPAVRARIRDLGSRVSNTPRLRKVQHFYHIKDGPRLPDPGAFKDPRRA